MQALLSRLGRDAGQRARQFAWLSASLGVTGAFSAAVLALRPDASPCTGAGETMAAVWNGEVRDQVQVAFSEQAKAYAEAAASRSTQQLDAYANQWVEMRTEACEASRVRGEQSDEVLTLRMACLDERLDKLGNLTSLLARADEATVQNSVQAVGALPALDGCADIETLRRGVAPPDDPEIAAQVRALRQDLHRVVLLGSTARFDEAIELSVATLAALRRSGYRPALAEGLAVHAKLESQRERYGPAQEAADEALLLAQTTGHQEQVVRSLLALMHIEGWGKKRSDVALRYGRQAEAILDRIDAWPEVRAELLTERAQLEARAGEEEAALASTEAALAIRRKLGTDRNPGAVLALTRLATGYQRLERYDEARAALDDAVDIVERELSPLHPDVGITHFTLGNLLRAQGHSEDALLHLRRALRVFEQSLGPDHSNVIATLNAIGLTQKALGRRDEARRVFERALDIVKRVNAGDDALHHPLNNNLGLLAHDDGNNEAAAAYFEQALEAKKRALGEKHEKVAFGYENLGRSLGALGRHDEAVAAYRRAVEILRNRNGPEDRTVAFSTLGLGLVLLDADQLHQAHRELLAAVRIYDHTSNASIDDVAGARFGLGRAEAELGNRNPARALAQTALLQLLARPDHHSDLRAEIEAWLAAHPAV
jgi:tetratricopeptide (TPR) repeat protein